MTITRPATATSEPASTGTVTTNRPRLVVTERGTSLRRQMVLQGEDGGFIWVRWPGCAAPAGFVTPRGALERSIARLRTACGSSFAIGRDRLGKQCFAMPAARSLSEYIITGQAPAAALPGQLYELGELLRLLHQIPPSADLAGAPPALDRVRDWLHPADTADRGRPSQIRTALRSGTGTRRWQQLSDTFTGLSADPVVDGPAVAGQAVNGTAVASHGWCGLGQLAPGLQPGSVRLTIGEDMGWAPAAVDVGFVLGQLFELEHFLPPQAEQNCDARELQWQSARDALLAGYRGTGTPQTLWWAAIGIALHVHDFATYFTVDDEELPRWAALLSQVVDAAAAA